MKHLPLWLLPICAASALAQTPAILSPHNSDFLKGLMQRGYFDLAEGLARAVEASSLPDVEKKRVAILALDIKAGKLGREGDAQQQKEVIIQTIKAREATIAQNPDSKESDTLRAEVTDQYGLLANVFKEAIAAEKDPQKQAAMRKEGDDLFRTAEEAMLGRRGETEKKRVADKPETDIPYVIAFFDLGRMKYYHSLLFPPESIEGKHAIEGALTVLDEFDLEFSDLLVAFEAKLIVSLCHKQLGHLEDALACTDEAIALRERVEKDQKGVYKVDEDAASVISRAVAQKQSFLKDNEADEQRWDKIIAAAKDYQATIPNPLRAEQGLAVLAAQAEAYMMKGESADAKATAEKLTEEDPKGRWGFRGQQILAELLAGGGNTPGTGSDLGKLMGIVRGLAEQGETDQALRMCRQVVRRATGPDDAPFAAEALLITGAIYASRQPAWYHEASLAYDTVYRRYPKTSFAPEAVWRSLNCYLMLKASEPLPYYKRAMDERSRVLRENYKDDPRVPRLQLIEATELQAVQKYLEAAAAFEKIPADSTVAIEARFGAADCWLRHARKLEASKLQKDAVGFVDKAKQTFKKLIDDVGAAQKATTDLKQRANLDSIDFRVRIALANLYLQEKPPLAAEVEALLKDIQLKDDNPNGAVIWALKIGALAAQDKVDEAVGMFDAALATLEKNKIADQRPLAAVAGTLARKLDERAAQTLKKGLRTGANETWRRAVGYYLRSAERASATDDIVQIADRLFVIGLMINGVDAKVETFYEVPDLKAADTATWDQAAELYERLINAGARDYRILLFRGRALAFLKRWPEAVQAFTELFNEPANKIDANNRLDAKVLAAKPELLTGYLEYGFALRAAGVANNDKALLVRATNHFDLVYGGVPADSKYWWYACYGQIQSQADRGDYKVADVAMRNLERRNPDFDGDRFRLKAQFTLLKGEIQQKVPRGK